MFSSVVKIHACEPLWPAAERVGKRLVAPVSERLEALGRLTVAGPALGAEATA